MGQIELWVVCKFLDFSLTLLALFVLLKHRPRMLQVGEQSKDVAERNQRPAAQSHKQDDKHRENVTSRVNQNRSVLHDDVIGRGLLEIFKLFGLSCKRPLGWILNIHDLGVFLEGKPKV